MMGQSSSKIIPFNEEALRKITVNSGVTTKSFQEDIVKLNRLETVFESYLENPNNIEPKLETRIERPSTRHRKTRDNTFTRQELYEILYTLDQTKQYNSDFTYDFLVHEIKTLLYNKYSQRL